MHSGKLKAQWCKQQMDEVICSKPEVLEQIIAIIWRMLQWRMKTNTDSKARTQSAWNREQAGVNWQVGWEERLNDRTSQHTAEQRLLVAVTRPPAIIKYSTCTQKLKPMHRLHISQSLPYCSAPSPHPSRRARHPFAIRRGSAQKSFAIRTFSLLEFVEHICTTMPAIPNLLCVKWNSFHRKIGIANRVRCLRYRCMKHYHYYCSLLVWRMCALRRVGVSVCEWVSRISYRFGTYSYF